MNLQSFGRDRRLVKKEKTVYQMFVKQKPLIQTKESCFYDSEVCNKPLKIKCHECSEFLSAQKMKSRICGQNDSKININQ
jgi:hypothetical protein